VEINNQFITASNKIYEIEKKPKSNEKKVFNFKTWSRNKKNFSL
jgi:hypothetical protein